MLRAEDIAISFGGVRAVAGVSFEVARGSITGLIGPNGAGKTTLFNLIARLHKPDRGRLTLDGARIEGLSPSAIFRAGLGRAFRIPRPFPETTVRQNVMAAPLDQTGERFWAPWLARCATARREAEVRARAERWIEFVGLTRLADAPARTLSGGQRKRLALARAMVAEPKIVLLDEPGAGVAPALLDRIADRVRVLNERGVTFLLIEHDMDRIAALCRPAMVMAEGRLLAVGDAAAVRRDPRVIEAYLGGAAA